MNVKFAKLIMYGINIIVYKSIRRVGTTYFT